MRLLENKASFFIETTLAVLLTATILSGLIRLGATNQNHKNIYSEWQKSMQDSIPIPSQCTQISTLVIQCQNPNSAKAHLQNIIIP